MSYPVKVTTTKPAGTQWYGRANPAENLRLNQWVLAQPGVLSAITKVTGLNQLTVLTVYESEAAYNAFRTAYAANADAQARLAHAAANDFQSVTEILG